MARWLNTRTLVAPMLVMHPCVSSCLGVKWCNTNIHIAWRQQYIRCKQDLVIDHSGCHKSTSLPTAGEFLASIPGGNNGDEGSRIDSSTSETNSKTWEQGTHQSPISISTFYMLNFSEITTTYIYILQWYDKSNWHPSSIPILHGQYHGCWCPADVRR